MRIFTLVFFLAVLLSCEPDQPADVLSEEKMEKVLWEMIQAEEWALQQHPEDTIARNQKANQLYAQVYQLNKITKDQFKKSYFYYSNRPTVLAPILDSVRNRSIPPMIEPSPSVRPNKRPFQSQ